MEPGGPEHALVGRDIPPAVGQHVVLTIEAKAWEMGKGMRGDSSMGGVGQINEVRENGGVCMVLWGATGMVHPYPTGVLGRFYLAVYPLAPAAPVRKRQEMLAQQQQQQQQQQMAPPQEPSSGKKASKRSMSEADESMIRSKSGPQSSKKKQKGGSSRVKPEEMEIEVPSNGGSSSTAPGPSPRSGGRSTPSDATTPTGKSSLSSSKKRKSAAKAAAIPPPLPDGVPSMVVEFEGGYRRIAIVAAETVDAPPSPSKGRGVPNPGPTIEDPPASGTKSVRQRSKGSAGGTLVSEAGSLLSMMHQGGLITSASASGALGGFAGAIAASCISDDGTFDASVMAGGATGAALSSMVGGLWAGLAEAVEEGFRDYGGGELEDVQRTGVHAGCVFLCLFACQGGDGASMLQSFAGAEAALGHSLSAIEASLKSIASTQDASPTKASGGRRKSSGGKKGRGGGGGGGGNWDMAQIVGCAMAAAGRIACEMGLGEEHVEQVRRITLAALSFTLDESIRSAGVLLIRDACVAYPAMRKDFVEELFVLGTSESFFDDAASLGVSLSKGYRCLSSISAAIIRVTQSGGGGEEGVLTRYLFTLVGNRAVKGHGGKGKDACLMSFLEGIVGDCSNLLHAPEWPAAEEVMSAACDRLDWILAGKNANVAAGYRNMAVELLGRGIESLANSKIADRQECFSILGLEPLSQSSPPPPREGGDLVGALVDGGEAGGETGSEHIGSVTGFQTGEEGEGSGGVYSVTYGNGSIDEMGWEELAACLRKAAGGDANSHPQQTLPEGLEARLSGLVSSYLSHNPRGVAHVGDAAAYLSREHKGWGGRQMGEDTSDARVAMCAYRRLLMVRTLLQGLGQRLRLLLGVLESRGGGDLGAGSARMRQRALQALTHVVKTDASVLGDSQLRGLVRVRFSTDPSALVRACAVEMMYHFASPSRRLSPSDLEVVMDRSRDVATSVRLQAMSLLASEIEWARLRKSKEISCSCCARVCAMIVDQDDGVQKKAMRTMLPLWFSGAGDQAVVDEFISVVGKCVADDGPSISIVQLLRRVLGSQASHGGGQEAEGEDDEPWLTSKEVNAARLSCKAIVASIVGKIHGKDAIEGLITSVGACEAISLLTCLRKIGEAYPPLLTPHAANIVSLQMLPSLSTNPPAGPAEVAERCRVLAASVQVMRLVLLEAAQGGGVVSPEVADTLQRKLSELANRVPEPKALERCVECMCACSKSALAGGDVPAKMIIKYVQFIEGYVKERKEANLRFVMTSLLSAGAVTQHLDFADALPATSPLLAACKSHQARLVKACVDHLAEDSDERLRRCAFQCLGGLMVSDPTLLLQKKVSKLVTTALGASGDPTSQLAVLRAFRVFLEEEDARISASAKLSKPKSGKEVITTERVSSMSTALSNDFLPLILEAMFSAAQPAGGEREIAQREGVRTEATFLVGVIVRRGLTAPQRVAPHLVALGARDDFVAVVAGRVYEDLVSRHRDLSAPNLITEGVMLAFSRSQGAVQDNFPEERAFGVPFEHVSQRGGDVRQIVKLLLKRADSTSGEYEECARRVEYLSFVLAHLSYKTIDGPLTCISTVGNMALISGTAALHGIRAILGEEDEEEVAASRGGEADAQELDALCRKGMIVSVLLALSRHLQSAYSLTDARVRSFGEGKEGHSKADKAVADVMPAFTPRVLFPKGYDPSNPAGTLKDVGRLEKLMMQCHINQEEASAAPSSTPAKDGAEGAEGAEGGQLLGGGDAAADVFTPEGGAGAT